MRAAEINADLSHRNSNSYDRPLSVDAVDNILIAEESKETRVVDLEDEEDFCQLQNAHHLTNAMSR